jgi:hypothetical protein
MLKTNIYLSLLWSLPLSLLSNLSAAALASTINLSVLPLSSSRAVQRCPEKLIAYQTPQPYREGGYAIDGMINLSDIATDITISQSDVFSTIWVGKLKPEYQNCQASGGMISINEEAYQGHSYLRVQMIDGQVKVILDMTGMRDANGSTTVIIYRGMRDGNPRWTWGGTD